MVMVDFEVHNIIDDDICSVLRIDDKGFVLLGSKKTLKLYEVTMQQFLHDFVLWRLYNRD